MPFPFPDEFAMGGAERGPRRPVERGFAVVKVIASNVRKGNILESEDGRLYVVLSAESFRPGKGTPTTQIDMRGLADGVKTTKTYKTTDQVERAFVEDRDFNYLYQDGTNYVFMNQENFEQIEVSEDLVGDGAAYLQENMQVKLSVFDGRPVAIELPPRVILEVVETEPVIKGQTASGSFKPAMLSNGVRTAVPTHIVAGTRIVVSTEDGAYVERAKE